MFSYNWQLLQKHNVLSINYLNGIMRVISFFRNTYVSFLYFCDFFYITFWFIVTATSKTWTQTLDPDPGPWKTWTQKTCTLKNMDPEKHGSWKTWNKYALREKCPNTDFFLVHIFPDLFVFSPNARKCGPEKTPYLEAFHAVMGLKNISDFWQLCFIKTMLYVICPNRFVY